MKLNEYKTIKISPNLHQKIKNHCIKNGYVMNRWLEKELEKIINEYNEEKNYK